MDLSRWIDGWAEMTPEKDALRCDGVTLDYAAFADAVGRLARSLRHALGLKHGDRVAYLGLNSPKMLVLLFACARTGTILVPLNWRLAPPEHRHILADSGAAALFAEPAFLAQTGPVLAALPPLKSIAYGPKAAGWQEYAALIEAPGGSASAGSPAELGDPLLLVYTSGTTGQPKGAVLTQEALLWNAVNATHAHDLTSADRILTTLPMFHVGGLNIQTLPALHAGASVTLHRRFDAGRMLKEVAAWRPSLTLMVPATLQACLRHPDFAATDLSSLRLIMAGSSTIPAALIEGFHARGIPVGQVYGATETAPVALYLRGPDARRKIGSTGKPAIHCRARIVDAAGSEVEAGAAGEILVQGPNLFRGYWNDPAATASAFRDGWYCTGDIGHRDAEGYYYIDDRKKDVIISGGENIYPAELENVLAACPEIEEAAVIGRPDPRWGEVAVAVVVRKPGAILDAAAVLALFEGSLARFKHPRAIVFARALPRNVMGKVLKHELRSSLDSSPDSGGES